MDTPLKLLRLKHGLAQREVASAIGISQGAYCRVENGEVVTSLEFAKRLVKHFGGAISVLEILDPKLYVNAHSSLEKAS
ncbi:MAG: helix-turn-helix transcriptional regulator [Acidobacteriota bacterium]|nr:helix-turn-helix transcriptional regulator [Acidobacteriota bacterium]